MPNMLLRDTDQMSMAHGLEVRVPLLDHLLVDRLATIPGAIKLPAEQRTNKWLLVEMVRDSLPAAVVDRKKMGFVFPWDRWLRNELHAFVDRHLLDRESVQAAGLVPGEVARVWRAFQAGRGGVRYADMLTLLNLVHWCQVNEVQLPSS
jgi:asparagine synthase (glutamine-hydrolysing)